MPHTSLFALALASALLCGCATFPDPLYREGGAGDAADVTTQDLSVPDTRSDVQTEVHIDAADADGSVDGTFNDVVLEGSLDDVSVRDARDTDS